MNKTLNYPTYYLKGKTRQINHEIQPEITEAVRTGAQRRVSKDMYSVGMVTLTRFSRRTKWGKSPLITC